MEDLLQNPFDTPSNSLDIAPPEAPQAPAPYAEPTDTPQDSPQSFDGSLGLQVQPDDSGAYPALQSNDQVPIPIMATSRPAKITTYWPGQGDPKEEGGMDTTLGHIDPNNPMAKIVPIEDYLNGNSKYFTVAGPKNELGTWKKLAIPNVGVANVYVNDTGSAVGDNHYDIPSMSRKTSDSSPLDTSKAAVMSMSGDQIRQEIGDQNPQSMLAGGVTQDSISQALKSGPQAKNSDGSLDYGNGISVYGSGIVQVDTPAATYQYFPGKAEPHIINKKPLDPTDPANINVDPNLKGEDLLKALPPNMQTIVKAMTNYDYPKVSSFALKSPYYQKVLNWAFMYDPNFDAKRFDVTQKAMNDFTTGRGSNILMKSNEALNQVPNIVDTINDLGNHDVTGVNTAENAVSRMMGSPKTTNFENAAKTFSSAVAAQQKGGTASATNDEIQMHLKDFNVNGSQSQQIGTVAQKAISMLAQIEAEKQRALSGLGPKGQLPYKLISDQSVDSINQLIGDPRVGDNTKKQLTKLLGQVAPEGAEPLPSPTSQTPTNTSQPIPKVGDNVNLKGVGAVTVTSVNPDGSFNYQPR